MKQRTQTKQTTIWTSQTVQMNVSWVHDLIHMCICSTCRAKHRGDGMWRGNVNYVRNIHQMQTSTQARVVLVQTCIIQKCTKWSQMGVQGLKVGQIFANFQWAFFLIRTNRKKKRKQMVNILKCNWNQFKYIWYKLIKLCLFQYNSI